MDSPLIEPGNSTISKCFSEAHMTTEIEGELKYREEKLEIEMNNVVERGGMVEAAGDGGNISVGLA